MPFDDPWTIALIAGAAVIAVSAVIYAMRKRGEKGESTPGEQGVKTEFKGSPFAIAKSVPKEDASHAKDELRILDIEREILSDAIRRLYEAQAEGKITEEERERLAQSYKSRMMTVKEAISKDESLVALHELEAMQEDLVKLFSDRFDELNKKIGELRQRTELKPLKEIPIRTEPLELTPASEEKSTGEERTKKKRKPPQPKSSPRTEAEKRIEEIRAEVEKVLDRLGQMENET